MGCRAFDVLTLLLRWWKGYLCVYKFTLQPWQVPTLQLKTQWKTFWGNFSHGAFPNREISWRGCGVLKKSLLEMKMCTPVLATSQAPSPENEVENQSLILRGRRGKKRNWRTDSGTVLPRTHSKHHGWRWIWAHSGSNSLSITPRITSADFSWLLSVSFPCFLF